jgi:Fe2+ or Zn2+ uptake regulation protein
MSQKEVYEILKELGGEATTRQIAIRAKEKFPGLSLYLYVSNRLHKLEKNGYVKRIIKDGKIVWKIIADYC